MWFESWRPPGLGAEEEKLNSFIYKQFFALPVTNNVETSPMVYSITQHVRRTALEYGVRGKISSRVLLLIPCAILSVLLFFSSTYNAINGPNVIKLPFTLSPSLTQSHRTTPVTVPHKAVILASYDGQNTEWLHTVPADWKIYRYILEGREAYSYLTYIIDHYDSLPDYMIFLHGHSKAWHQIEPAAWKIRALNLKSLERQGYINLRCTQDSGCTDDTLLGTKHPWIGFAPLRDILGNMMSVFWATYMEPYGFGSFPEELGQPCCAQFAVTRAAVLSRPIQFYRNFRSPLEWNIKQGKAVFGYNWDEYHAGTLYEYLWHVVFGKDPKHCPDEELCKIEYFSDAIACAKYPGRFQDSFGWRNVNCSSIYEREKEIEGVSRVVVEQFWQAGADTIAKNEN